MSSVQILQKDTYLAMIEAAVGTNLYRKLYALVDGQKQDILQDGDLSCAFFVSSLLHHFGLVNAPHATVTGLERDLVASGWVKTETSVPGAVLIWEAAPQKSGVHAHSGFVVGDHEAISHSDKERTPVKHHLTFGVKSDGSPARALVSIYTCAFLK